MKLETLIKRARSLQRQAENLRLAAYEMELKETGIRKTAFTGVEGQLNDAQAALQEAADWAESLRFTHSAVIKVTY